MLVFRCTKKARKVLGLTDRDLFEDDGDDLTQWFVDVATFEHRRCMLFTHKVSLYSFWVPGVRKADRERFGDLFGQHLLRTLAADGFDGRAFGRLFREGHRFARTNDRSVLGSMNDFIWSSRWHVQRDGIAQIGQLNAQLNRTPMGAIAPKGQLEFPVEVLEGILHPAGMA